MPTLIKRVGAPSDGDYAGIPEGSFVIDTTNRVIYKNVGTVDAPVWSAEGQPIVVVEAVFFVDENAANWADQLGNLFVS